MSFKERLRTLRKAKKITQATMANDLKIRQPSVHDYEKGRTSPSVEIIQNIAKIYGCNLHWLLTGEGEMFVSENTSDSLKIQELEKSLDKKIEQKISSMFRSEITNYNKSQYSSKTEANDFWYLNIMGDIACGEPMPLVEDVSEQLIPISKATLPNPNDCDILRVNGESMSPDIEHSDLVVIRRETDWNVCNNRIVAVRNSDGLTLKKLVFDERHGTATLIPSNRKYKPIVADDTCILCGYLILLVRYF